jgi:O-antigen biosynthesis protein
MSAPAVGGLASVIVPCWNQLEFTRKCIWALMRQTGPNWELIVIDNGSTDGTGSYLAGVQDASPVPVTVIANFTNAGFPAAINQGLQNARGEYLVVLNNDVVVTEGWLGQLIGLADIKVEKKGEVRNANSDLGAAECGPVESRP